MPATFGALLELPVTPASALQFLKETAVILRLVQALFALLCFSSAAAGVPVSHPAWYTFLIFVAVTAFLIDLACVVIYAVGRSFVPTKFFGVTQLPMAEMLISSVWAVFWLVGSVTFAIQVPIVRDLQGFRKSLATAAVIFGFFCSILWCYTAILAFLRVRDTPVSAESLLSSSNQPGKAADSDGKDGEKTAVPVGRSMVASYGAA